MKTLVSQGQAVMTRKLTLRTRSGLRSSANKWDFRQIRFYKTLLKADDDSWQRVIARNLV